MWETIKDEIRNLRIKYATYKKRNENKKEKDLSSEKHKIEQELVSFDNNSTKNDENVLKRKLIENMKNLNELQILDSKEWC